MASESESDSKQTVEAEAGAGAFERLPDEIIEQYVASNMPSSLQNSPRISSCLLGILAQCDKGTVSMHPIASGIDLFSTEF